MEQKEKNYVRAERSMSEISLLQDMSREEIMQKCLDLNSAFKKANSEIETYRELLKKIVAEYEQLKAKNPRIDETEYNKCWSWVNKIVFVLKKIKRPLLSSEIIAFITPYEPVLQYSRHKAQAFSANLNKAVKYGRVVAYKLGGSRGYYYILPDWLDNEGRISKEYEDKIFFK